MCAAWPSSGLSDFAREAYRASGLDPPNSDGANPARGGGGGGAESGGKALWPSDSIFFSGISSGISFDSRPQSDTKHNNNPFGTYDQSASLSLNRGSSTT